MKSELLDDLVAVNIKYSAGARPLRTRAIAQVAAKVLYMASPDERMEANILAENIGLVCGVDKVEISEVEDALALLEDLGLVEKATVGWKLSSKGTHEIEVDLNRSRSVTDSVLDRHFPKTIAREELRAWFRDSCVEFFGQYGTYWAASVCRTPPKATPMPSDWATIAKKTVAEHSLTHHTGVLTRGFGGFLGSVDARDQEHKWDLGQAMFASRLIAANIGIDPITTKEIGDAMVFLDTNVLLVSVLEAHRYAPSIKTLVESLGTLNIQLTLLPRTLMEYDQRVSSARELTLRVVARYPLSIVKKARDEFTRTAIGRGCTSMEDFERFFDEVGQTPNMLDGKPITMCDNEKVLRAADDGEGDAELQSQIADAWKSARRNDKKPNAVVHDAALMSAVEEARVQGQRSWALTTDKTMVALSIKRSGQYDIPSWISFDALIQIFALDISGPNQKATDFAGLMSAVLANEVQPMLGTFETQDLAWLLDIEERCADLGDEEVETCVMAVTRARLSGKRHDDPELQLAVQRAFQGERLELASDLSVSRADAKGLETQLKSERVRSQNLRDELVTEKTSRFRREAWKSFAWKSGLAVLLGGGLIAAGWLLADSSTSDDSILLRIGLPAALLVFGITAVSSTLWRQGMRLRQSLRSAADRAKEEATNPIH